MSKITAIVTGGARGIGEHICRLLHSQNVTVIIVDLLVEQGQALANELQGSIFKRMDVSKIEEWRELIKEIQKIDYLFLNAGRHSVPEVTAMQMRQQYKPNLTDQMHIVHSVMEVNFFQTIYGVDTVTPIMQSVSKRGQTLKKISKIAKNRDFVLQVYGVGTIAPIMQAAGQGAIMVTISMGGIIPWPADPIYIASKHAQLGYMRSIKKYLNKINIKSYEACPAVVNTDLIGEDRDQLPFQTLDPKIVAEKMVDLVLKGKPSQTFTMIAGRNPLVQEQKEFIKCFQSYDVGDALKN